MVGWPNIPSGNNSIRLLSCIWMDRRVCIKEGLEPLIKLQIPVTHTYAYRGVLNPVKRHVIQNLNVNVILKNLVLKLREFRLDPLHLQAFPRLFNKHMQAQFLCGTGKKWDRRLGLSQFVANCQEGYQEFTPEPTVVLK